MQSSKNELISALENTLREYKLLKDEYPLVIDGIITHNVLDSINLNEGGLKLSDCLNFISDQSLKRFAYRVFTKYSLEENFVIFDDQNLINNSFFITIGGQKYNALNPKIVSENDGTLFSLLLHKHLSQNNLNIYDNSGNNYIVYNLFGRDDNTQYIRNIINNSIFIKSNNWDKLLLVVGKSEFSTKSKRNFDKSSLQIQEAIIARFQAAKDRKGISFFFADGTLIKDVTAEKETEIKVYELRIFDPVAYRVYFYETENVMYLGLIEPKPQPKVQSSHISTATSIIKELVKLG